MKTEDDVPLSQPNRISMKNVTVFLLFCLITHLVSGARVERTTVYSAGMNNNLPVVVIIPNQASETSRCPVVYLLHGHGGNANSWIQIKPELSEMADKNNIIFVCPDGKNSWYWDSPTNPAYRFETFVSRELVTWVDSLYPSIADRKARAITGLSMGGHGALWLSFRNKDVYGAAGSTSGGVDIRPFPNNWNMKDQLGELSQNPDVWDNHTVINQVDKIANGDLALIIDCGYRDFFFDVNNNLHAKLMANNIGHDYLVRPGVHDGNFWNNSIDYQVLFFKKFFVKNGYK